MQHEENSHCPSGLAVSMVQAATRNDCASRILDSVFMLRIQRHSLTTSCHIDMLIIVLDMIQSSSGNYLQVTNIDYKVLLRSLRKQVCYVDRRATGGTGHKMECLTCTASYFIKATPKEPYMFSGSSLGQRMFSGLTLEHEKSCVKVVSCLTRLKSEENSFGPF